jgi:hypothetical protein
MQRGDSDRGSYLGAVGKSENSSFSVEATTDAIDYRQMKLALERCATTLGRKPKQIVERDALNRCSV